MKFDHRHYVPCIRWKQGEYRAMYRLSRTAKGFITPLIEVPEIGYDFETKTLIKSLDAHLSVFVDRINKNWLNLPCFVDLNLINASGRMDDGRHPVSYIFDELRALKCKAIPVTGINRKRQYQQAVRQVAAKDNRGLCLRVSIEEATMGGLKSSIDALISRIGSDVSECDLVIDLDAPNFEPIKGFMTLVEKIVCSFPFFSKWRTFTIIGTSFPSSMAEVKQGRTIIPRNEWLLYKQLVVRLDKQKFRLPTFGDYVINHPTVLTVDMRLVKPSATIRYAIDDAWMIVKGSNVRDNGYDQYKDLCKSLTASTYYFGPSFSEGDNYIANCATGIKKTGNLSTWRMVGSNHHLEKVVQDIANLFDS